MVLAADQKVDPDCLFYQDADRFGYKTMGIKSRVEFWDSRSLQDIKGRFPQEFSYYLTLTFLVSPDSQSLK